MTDDAGGGAPDHETDTAPATKEPPRAIGVLLSVLAAGCLIAACFSHRWLANRVGRGHHSLRLPGLVIQPGQPGQPGDTRPGARRGDDEQQPGRSPEPSVWRFGYSPLSFQTCEPTCDTCEPACTEISNFEVARNTDDLPFQEDRVSAAFPIAGLMTFVVLLVAAAGLLTAAAIAAANKRPNLPISPTTIALLGLMLGLITGCVFVATKPGEVGAVGVAWSFWSFGIGSVAGLAGAQLLARQIRPPDPDLLHDAMNADQF